MSNDNEFDPDKLDLEACLIAKPGTVRVPKKAGVESAEVKELKDLVYRAQMMLSRKEYLTTARLIDDDDYLNLWLENAAKALKG